MGWGYGASNSVCNSSAKTELKEPRQNKTFSVTWVVNWNRVQEMLSSDGNAEISWGKVVMEFINELGSGTGNRQRTRDLVHGRICARNLQWNWIYEVWKTSKVLSRVDLSSSVNTYKDFFNRGVNVRWNQFKKCKSKSMAPMEDVEITA